MCSNFEKKYIAQDYRVYRENILYEKELGMLPLTQPYVEKEMKIESLQKEIKDIENEYSVIHNKIQEKKNEIYKLKNNTSLERRKYVRKCPQNNCQGFLSSQLKCELCNCWVCSECREIKGMERDTEHTCNPEILESIKVMNEDSKPCPHCASLIYKIEGCSQMFCTECNTAFNWNTLRIETGAIHNPHYFEWQRRININQEAERNPNEILCGRELDHHFLRIMKQKMILHHNSYYIITNRETINNMLDFITKEYPNNSSILKGYIENMIKHREFKTDMNTLDSYTFIFRCFEKLYNKITNIARMNLEYKYSEDTDEKKILNAFKKTLLFDEYNKKILNLEEIIRSIIHIREIEIAGFPIGDRVSNNLDLRISFMRNRISEENMKTEIQKRDKRLQRNTEMCNILRMFVSCITDLLYRLVESIHEYDNIMNEMNQLRLYTNQCILTTLSIYNSSMRHHIDEKYQYRHKIT